MDDVTLDIEGTFEPALFIRWIERHARKLGLHVQVAKARQDHLSVCAQGPAELVDALEMACLLGPREVWVHHIRRQGGAVEMPII